jgi:predicted metal-dependent phosphoesterase TrpH
MSKADLHIHTTFSTDGTASVREALEGAVRAGLDVIAITDHDEVRGSLEARAISTEYGVHVIPGAEVSTKEGHLIVLFVERNIPADMSLIDTLIAVRELGGMAIVPHPDHPIRNSISRQNILEALEHPQAREALHGIEVCNMNTPHIPFNQRSQQAADTLPLAQVASSDAHTAAMIGAAVTHFEGGTARDVRRALQRRATQPEQINHEGPLQVFLN